MAILRDGDLYRRVDQAILGAFGYHFVIDMSQPPNLSVALTETNAPDGTWWERIDVEAINYQKQAIPITDFSDGVKVFVGLIAAVESMQHVLILIDEPEAYLHPTLARRLGAHLTRVAQERRATLVVATHSADFLMGCVGEFPQTEIVRLDFNGHAGLARPLSGTQVAELMGDPLLRSTDALDALFSKGAVVCEADSDRAFYGEINRRLVAAETRQGADDAVFLNAQNWQTISRIAGPLRRLGIPSAIVMDLDTLTVDDNWPDIFKLATSEPTELELLRCSRRKAGDLLVTAGYFGSDDKRVLKCKVEGLASLASEEDRDAVLESLMELAKFGIFIVPVGVLENWLKSFGLTNKQTWVTDMFKRLGSKSSPVYVEPGTGDVWEFVESISRWMLDQDRKG